MKHNRYLYLLLPIRLRGVLFVTAPPAKPISVGFDVSLNTSGLVGNSAAPFYINFQLNDGSGSATGDANNTVKISNFQPIGGVGLPSTMGGASGNLSSIVRLSRTAPFPKHVYPRFYSGQHAQLPCFSDLERGLRSNARRFSFSILDSAFAPVPTTGLGDALVLVNIVDLNAGAPLIIQHFGSDPNSPIVFEAPLIQKH